MNMEDEELKELFQKVKIWLFVFIVFGGLFTYILVTKFGSQEISINKKIEEKGTLTVLVVSSDVDNIRELKYYLNSNGIDFETVYKDRERYYNDFLQKVSLTEREVVVPAVIYIENGSAKNYVSNIKKLDDLKSFIEYNNLSGKE